MPLWTRNVTVDLMQLMMSALSRRCGMMRVYCWAYIRFWMPEGKWLWNFLLGDILGMKSRNFLLGMTAISTKMRRVPSSWIFLCGTSWTLRVLHCTSTEVLPKVSRILNLESWIFNICVGNTFRDIATSLMKYVWLVTVIYIASGRYIAIKL